MNNMADLSTSFQMPPGFKSTGLLYVNDNARGFSRKKTTKGFVFFDLKKKRIKDKKVIDRIRSLVIPPAWEQVWICPNPNGHIQVTARDARGRKQYRYHPEWRKFRDENKYGRLKEFGDALIDIRKKTDEDLSLPGLPKEKVLAVVVKLLERTFIRIGNESYAKENNSFGLTTLRDQHVKINGSSIQFQFRGKSGVKHSVGLNDRRLASIVKKCKEIPGYELFQYVDNDGNFQSISSTDVNGYLQSITGKDFTAKDFRTWFGSVLAADFLSKTPPEERTTFRKKKIVEVISGVAKRLGNTPAICKKCYVHPLVLEAYDDGTMFQLKRKRGKKFRSAEEEFLMQLLISEKTKKRAA
jgi:DNA topoisomerase I